MPVSHLQGFSAGLFAFFRDANGDPLTPRSQATNKPSYNHRLVLLTTPQVSMPRSWPQAMTPKPHIPGALSVPDSDSIVSTVTAE